MSVVSRSVGRRVRLPQLLAALFCLAALAVAPAGAAATSKPPKYRYKASAESYSLSKSVCADGTYTITETVITEYRFRRTGVGEVGKSNDFGKGEAHASGSRTITTDKTVQGPDAAAPEHYSATEQLAGSDSDFSPFTKSGAGIRLELGIPDAEFFSMGTLKKGKSKTFSLDEEAQPEFSSSGNCSYEERSSKTGALLVSRLR
jgi:hypothetical protein